MIGYIILSLFVLVVLIGLFFGFKAYKGARTWVWPEGTRVVSKVGSYTVNFIYSGFKPEDPKNLARLCAIAANCLNKYVVTSSSLPKEFAVHVLSDDMYDKIYDSKYGSKSNGMGLSVSRKSGPEIMFMSVCRLKPFMDTINNDGELIIHELLHYMVRREGSSHALDSKEYTWSAEDPGDRIHSNQIVWNYQTGMEGLACKDFIKATK